MQTQEALHVSFVWRNQLHLAPSMLRTNPLVVIALSFFTLHHRQYNWVNQHSYTFCKQNWFHSPVNQQCYTLCSQVTQCTLNASSLFFDLIIRNRAASIVTVTPCAVFNWAVSISLCSFAPSASRQLDVLVVLSISFLPSFIESVQSIVTVPPCTAKRNSSTMLICNVAPSAAGQPNTLRSWF